MASNEEERIKLTFDSNAKQIAQDTNKLGQSIDNVTESGNEQTESIKKQTESVKSYKTQIKEAVIEQQKLAQQYGATSEQAIAAAKKVANLTDEMQFQKDLVKSYNPDEKFRGLTQTAGLAALALSGVKDGFTALGVESKTLDKIIGSAQAILGVTSAVAALSDAYEVLTATQKAKSAANLAEAATAETAAVAETTAATATWSWNAALLANPIIAITAGIVAATAAIYAYVKITSDAATEEEKARVASMQLTIAIDNQARSFENNSKFLSENNNHKIALLRASGASEAQIYKETAAYAQQEIQLAKNNRANAERLEQIAYEQNRLNNNETTQEALKKAKENLQKAQNQVSDAFDKSIKAQQDHEIAIVQAQTDARKKAEDEAEKARQKEKADRDKHNNEILKQQTQHHNDLIKLGQNEFNAPETTASRVKVDEERAKATDERNDAEREARNKAAEQELEDLKYWSEQADEAIAQSTEDRIKRKEVENQALSDLGNAGINAAKDLFGKNKAIQKGVIATEGAISLGKVAINTVEQVSEDNAASPLTFGLPWSAVHIATGALGAASIIANTNKQLQALGGGSISGGSSGVSAPGGGGSVRPSVAFNNTASNQIGQSVAQVQADQPPLKVFVAESDITKAQNNVQVLVKKNTF